MGWLAYALLTVFFYAIFDTFVKLSSSRIHDGLGGFVINLVAMLVMVVYLGYLKLQGENVFVIKENGLLYSTIAGIVIGIATITFMKFFATGASLSIGVPLIRIGIVILASLIGVVFLKEGLSLRYVVGFVFSTIGIYLIISSK